MVVEPTDRDTRWGTRGREDRMARAVTRIADGANNRHAGQHATLHRLRQRVRKITPFKIASGRNVDDAHAVLFCMSQNPFQPSLNLAFADTPRPADFDEDKVSG